MFACIQPEADRICFGMILLAVSRHVSNAAHMVQEDGPTAEEISTLLTLEQRSYEAALEENVYWSDMIVSCYQARSFKEVCCSPVSVTFCMPLPLLSPPSCKDGLLLRQHCE